jgi:hypothetical protein
MLLHALVQINAVVKLAAALADEGQSHPVKEADAATQICSCLAAGEVACRRGRWMNDRRCPAHCRFSAMPRQ